MVSLNPILRVQNYFVQTWNKQNPETLSNIVNIARIAIAFATAGFAAAGIYGKVKVITSVVATSIGIIAFFILNHATQKTKPVDSEEKIKKIAQCQFIVNQNDLDGAKEIVISEKGQVKINAAQYQILSKCNYFKAMLNWNGIHKDETMDFARVIDNMNVWMAVILEKDLNEEVEDWRIRLNVSKDSVALNLLGGKIQRGIDVLVENLYQAHQCSQSILISFWETLLMENVDLQIQNADLIKSLFLISQELELRQIPSKLLKFLIREKDRPAVEKLMNEFKGILIADELKSSSIAQFNINLGKLDESKASAFKDNALEAILSKFTCDTFVIDSYINIDVLNDTYFLLKTKKFIIDNEVTNRILGRVIDAIVTSDNVERIDFSENKYFDNGHTDHRAVLLKHGFSFDITDPSKNNVFVKNK